MTASHSPGLMRLAFVDLETTGATATIDRITEIGIVTVDIDMDMGSDGSLDEGSVREWSSLVNPGTRIPPFIEALTGISNAMVADAPDFSDLAPRVATLLDGRLFIAHNARFDHGFLKNEFRRAAIAGIDFGPTVLCTVKLSRKLYPGFARHNLDSLIERHGLSVSERHRALGDARLIWQFWQTARRERPPEEIAAAVRQLTARPALPSQIDPAVIDDLPDSHGVYLFHGDNDALLYVGKSNNIRRRVLAHFSGDHGSAKELDLSQQLRRVSWIATQGEIGALLQEAALIKARTPLHNHQLRRNDEVCAWRLTGSGESQKLSLAPSDDLFFSHDTQLFGPFINARKANAALRALVEAQRLCPVLLGLEKGRRGKPCFASQVDHCLGACAGRETLAEHHQRLVAALQSLRMKPWPYPGPIGIREGSDLHVIDGWAYLGTATNEQDAWSCTEGRKTRFDRDVYQILLKRLPRLRERITRLG